METPTQERSIVREAWERTKKFVLPEEAMSLKLLFDNVRNYLMCAAVVAAVVALGEPGTSEQAGTLTVFAVFLVGANALQSWFIIERITSRIGRFQSEVRPRWGKFRRRLMRVFLVVLMLPVIIAAFEGFSILLVWAIHGGKQASGL